MNHRLSKEKKFLEKLTQISEENLTNEQFGVSELARGMGMSRTSLHRNVKSITGTSASRFIRIIRLKKAMQLLRETSSSNSEVAFQCGFHSVTYFTKCFSDHYGFSPGSAHGCSIAGLEHHTFRCQFVNVGGIPCMLAPFWSIGGITAEHIGRWAC